MSDARSLFRGKAAVRDRKKVTHPLARYNSMGQLVCELCNSVVKNELMWPAHLRGKQHATTVANLKALKAQQEQQQRKAQVVKKDADGFVKPRSLKLKPQSKATSVSEDKGDHGGLPSDFFDNAISEKKNTESSPQPPVTAATAGVPADFFDSAEGAASGSDQLPAGFFDDKPAKQPAKRMRRNPEEDGETKKTEEQQVEEEETEEKDDDAAVPKGFFDDKKLDAKVRNVNIYVEKEAEWERFQKEMADQEKVSETLMEEDVQETMRDRAQIETEEKRSFDERLALIKKIREEVKQKEKDAAAKKEEGEKNAAKEDEDSDSDDDDDFDEMGWRSKAI